MVYWQFHQLNNTVGLVRYHYCQEVTVHHKDSIKHQLGTLMFIY